VSKKSLVLMTLSVSHPSAPNRVPTLDMLSIENETPARKGAWLSFFLDDEGTVSNNDRTT
jgi:hypothetical protein